MGKQYQERRDPLVEPTLHQLRPLQHLGLRLPDSPIDLPRDEPFVNSNLLHEMKLSRQLMRERLIAAALALAQSS